MDGGHGVEHRRLARRAEQLDQGRYAARLEDGGQSLLVAAGHVVEGAGGQPLLLRVAGGGHGLDEGGDQGRRAGEGEAGGVLARQLVDEGERLGDHELVVVGEELQDLGYGFDGDLGVLLVVDQVHDR